MPTKPSKPEDKPQESAPPAAMKSDGPKHMLLTLGRMYAEAIASKPPLERQILARAAEDLCQGVSRHLGE